MEAEKVFGSKPVSWQEWCVRVWENRHQLENVLPVRPFNNDQATDREQEKVRVEQQAVEYISRQLSEMSTNSQGLFSVIESGLASLQLQPIYCRQLEGVVTHCQNYFLEYGRMPVYAFFMNHPTKRTPTRVGAAYLLGLRQLEKEMTEVSLEVFTHLRRCCAISKEANNQLKQWAPNLFSAVLQNFVKAYFLNQSSIAIKRLDVGVNPRVVLQDSVTRLAIPLLMQEFGMHTFVAIEGKTVAPKAWTSKSPQTRLATLVADMAGSSSMAEQNNSHKSEVFVVPTNYQVAFLEHGITFFEPVPASSFQAKKYPHELLHQIFPQSQGYKW